MKKKGEFKLAKLRHKRQQALYDAIKEVREKGEAYCFFHNKKFKLTHSEEDQYNLVKIGGRIKLAFVVNKDGLRAIIIDKYGGFGNSIHVSWEQVLCSAKEI